MAKYKRPRQHYDLVEIVWDDAAGLGNGWLSKEEEAQPQHVISVGFLIKESDDYYIYASDTDNDGSHNGRTQIPRGMVRTLRVLRKADKVKDVNAPLPTIHQDTTRTLV